MQNFTKIFCKPITLHKEIKPENIILTYDSKKLIIIDREDINEDIYSLSEYIQRDYILYKIPKTIHNDELIKYNPFSSYQLIWPYHSLKSNQDEKLKFLKSYQTSTSSNIVNKYACIIKLEFIQGEWSIDYFINNRILSNIELGKREYNIRMLYQLIDNQLFQDVYSNLQDKLQLNNFIDYKKDYDLFTHGNYLKDNVKLFDYQFQDIEWMRNLEYKIINEDNKISFSYITEIECVNERFVFNCKKLKPISSKKSNSIKTDTIEYFGGNLISDLGLGKTLIALYHIISSQDDENKDKYDKYVSFDNNCNYFYKRGSKKGSKCKLHVDKDELYCKNHKSSIFVEKRGIVYNNIEELQLNDYIVSHYNPLNNRITKLIKTNATLIFCPSQLCDQWIREYYDKFETKKRILMISTKDQYDNITLGDLLFADIVIVSYSFLLNDIYGINKNHHRQHNYVDKYFKINDDNKKISELMNSKVFNDFSLFMWNRVCYDEVHEIQNMYNSFRITNIIKSIQSKFKWNISGTPFSNGLTGYLNIINHNTTINMSKMEYIDGYKAVNLDKLLEYKMNGNLIDKTRFLFRRNTKDSIKSEYSGNIIAEHTYPINFTEQERNIYNSYLIGHGSKYSDFLIKLCCHCQLNNDTKDIIKNCKTLKEIENALLNHNKSKIDDLDKKLDILQKEINELENKLIKYTIENYNDDIEISEIKSKISIMKRNSTIFKNDKENLRRTYNYLKNKLETIDENDSCPICLEDIEKENLTLTKCGHKFCWDCINMLYKTNNSNVIKCPQCKSDMKKDDVFLIKHNDSGNSLDLDKSEELCQIVDNIKSSKIGNIIYFLKNLNKNDKVILFSQWDELLTLVGNNLEKYNLKIVYCNGSLYKRKKNIEEFKKNNSINIIMLSSRNAASGLNLTEANKIILLEPVYGNKEYRNSIENQAIGRADRIGQKNPIEVFRFIIKDTIEEDILHNKIDDSKLKIMMI